MIAEPACVVCGDDLPFEPWEMDGRGNWWLPVCGARSCRLQFWEEAEPAIKQAALRLRGRLLDRLVREVDDLHERTTHEGSGR